MTSAGGNRRRPKNGNSYAFAQHRSPAVGTSTVRGKADGPGGSLQLFAAMLLRTAWLENSHDCRLVIVLARTVTPLGRTSKINMLVRSFKFPPGMGLIDKIRGEPRWTPWLRVSPRFRSDALALLSNGRPLFLAKHERKTNRTRWIRARACKRPTLQKFSHKHTQSGLRRNPESSKSFQEPQATGRRSGQCGSRISGEHQHWSG